ncbi:2-keto-4-pentenoate hydratase [Methylobacterium sp. PvP062]|jgi:2-keto-4-pentenoate hydratase|uniref:2-keto-4-pentenoate hydratase n=1 Tax=Methylobacterium radiotolerans TaxID=31998 RepID=A0ABV2NI13_9HYPH|nr:MULTISPECIES: fumarylacetoacetate hydrolase family protein [Methylobacterium]MCX7333960.1 fumarylacetoacetate hydrolase family protein [Hyphomicrobiales bacterium]GAN50247.1 fumarylacetoacetate hydrolase [Methylobacterium sp. ME121]KZC03193.1 2-oxopent-4-enoate hydratase [Methylobacterium radiotolerans]MBN6820089.1 fumarylacetoacetate hydrolase family protein [Methylobacterium organophilum]MBP2497133.1 2-keto-4-pentenoate hydratase [Methylobacterium sp. PvP105]
MLALRTASIDPDAQGRRLAQARIAGNLADVDLSSVMTLEDAEDVSDATVRALGWAQIGYALVGTHPAVARTLRLGGPVVGPLLREAILDDGGTLRLPRGALGASVGLTFMIGRSFPFTDEEATTARNALGACAACRLDLHIVGRRTALPTVLDERAATADLGLEVAHVAGPWIDGWMSADIAAGEASLAIDGNVVARGHGRDVMGDPLNAVAWLARHLADRGSGLNGGDLVSVGSCCGLAQVLPGQILTARLGGLGPISLRLC